MATTVYVPRAPQVVEWPLVPFSPLDKIVSTIALTTSSNTTDFQVDGFSSIAIDVAVTANAGTGGSNAFTVFAQRRLSDGVTYDDVASLQITGSTGTKCLSFVNGGNTIDTQASGSLAANTVQTVAISGWWRLLWTVGSAGNTTTCSMSGTFKQ